MRRTGFVVFGLAVLIAPACSGTSKTADSTTAQAARKQLTLVALGDSWPEGAHCGRCRTFAGRYADGLKARTGRAVKFVDLTGSAQPFFQQEGGGTASLLHAVRKDQGVRQSVASGDVIMIATGPNELERAFKPYAAGRCGKSDHYACVTRLQAFWRHNFDAILDETSRLRKGKPTAVRLVSAANFFVSDPNATKGLPADAMTFGAKAFEALNNAACSSARAHDALCVDVRPILNGPTLDRPVDENSPRSMQKVADALLATGIAELKH